MQLRQHLLQKGRVGSGAFRFLLTGLCPIARHGWHGLKVYLCYRHTVVEKLHHLSRLWEGI